MALLSNMAERGVRAPYHGRAPWILASLKILENGGKPPFANGFQ
ncbi:hypothetical protein [Altererythrobacter sp. MTPC7]